MSPSVGTSCSPKSRYYSVEGSTDSVDRDPAVRDVTIPITSIRWTTSLGAVRRGTMAPI